MNVRWAVYVAISCLRVRRSEDDRILREMLTPNLDEALEALGYWIRAPDAAAVPPPGGPPRGRADDRFWQARAITGARRSPVALILSRGAAADVARLAVAYHARRILARMTTVAVDSAALAAVVMLAGR